MPITFLLDADTAKLEQSMNRAREVITQQTGTMLGAVQTATSGMVKAFGESSSALEALLSSSGALSTLDQFETRFGSFGINIEGTAKQAQFAIGTLVLGLRGFSLEAIAEFSKGVLEANKQLYDLSRTATLLGQSTDSLQSFQYAMKTIGGIDAAESLKTSLALYAKANAEFNEVKSGGSGGNITKLFESNGLSLKDANGELKDFQTLMEDVARLIASAHTEIDKIRIGQLLGLSQEWVTALGKGPLALREAQEAAKGAGAIIDKELVKKAAEFDEWWNSSWSNMTTRAKAAAAEIGQYLYEMINGTNVDTLTDRLTDLQKKRVSIAAGSADADPQIDDKIAATERDLAEAARERLAKALKGKAEQAPDISDRQIYGDSFTQGYAGALLQPGKLSGQFEKEREAERQARVTTINRLPTGKQTVIPSTARDAAVPNEDEVDRYIKQLEKTVDVIEAQVRVQGLGNAERVKAIDLARAEAAARERGTALTDAERKEIDRLAQAHADATKRLEDYKKAQQAVADATNFFGQQAIDVFNQMIFQGAKAADVFKSLAQTIVKAALQAELLGSGPLAGIFGTTGQNGGVGGLLGALTKSFTGGLFGGAGGDAGSLINPIAGARADGGPVMAGGTYLVGERGPELLRMASDGVVIPNLAGAGQSSAPISVTINNTSGAQIETRQQPGPDGRQQLRIEVAAAIADDWRQRGPIRKHFENRGVRG